MRFHPPGAVRVDVSWRGHFSRIYCTQLEPLNNSVPVAPTADQNSVICWFQPLATPEIEQGELLHIEETALPTSGV